MWKCITRKHMYVMYCVYYWYLLFLYTFRITSRNEKRMGGPEHNKEIIQWVPP